MTSLEQVRAAWKNLDPRGTGSILQSDLGLFVKSVDPPLGFKTATLTPLQLENIRAEASAFPLAQPGKVRFRDILTVLSLHKLGRAAIPHGHELETVSQPSKFRSAIRAVINELRMANADKARLKPKRQQNWFSGTESVAPLNDVATLESFEDTEQTVDTNSGVGSTELPSSGNAGKMQMLLEESSGKSKQALEEMSPLERMQMLAQHIKPKTVDKEPSPVSQMQMIAHTNSTEVEAAEFKEMSPLERMQMLVKQDFSW